MAFVMPLGWCTKKFLAKLLLDRTSYCSAESNKNGPFKVWNKYKLLLSTLCCCLVLKSGFRTKDFLVQRSHRNHRPKTGRISNEAKQM